MCVVFFQNFPLSLRCLFPRLAATVSCFFYKMVWMFFSSRKYGSASKLFAAVCVAIFPSLFWKSEIFEILPENLFKVFVRLSFFPSGETSCSPSFYCILHYNHCSPPHLPLTPHHVPPPHYAVPTLRSIWWCSWRAARPWRGSCCTPSTRHSPSAWRTKVCWLQCCTVHRSVICHARHMSSCRRIRSLRSLFPEIRHIRVVVFARVFGSQWKLRYFPFS